ncbi:hypothetical protein A3B21_00880 [Candidatus Uhrbacteria bacterium RIFCSPLOWO2_01_FULL_47_24]|uniref:Alanine--tRNA ligase n=1 Tax=Candidatus Uhrbacteria bacterium RIFCSPLOWO2_01_FULL_47_24 TaxID=1802401 RepID=A0A1F7UNW1_9BACT|nr:MAG: hypothetical protein A2753_00230 [Candidatus Uhrbacteria bacterium RIFCSPHIGHO2_01_FULL_47_11]OGL68584.1 MAG: hypothetical protein A3D58_02555 [Candidatus Uhrbacteria bacterium RIFCSPHIGHO2_02_FULL_46_47]OGL79929.1 MAG: hypothetical protein A3B21_00880 [Candidatus Uhrbacteria bacterium RIFCSPLOWO2_01_FULL_47_24]OGL84790.1 MAG: hypothetical protein A3J03_01310 [Candidatus Uhrbacteria bacterium RIFCSPLOWO2_02_FULL_46_25]
MSGAEIRTRFLTFFKERGHVIVPSSSLLPDDPSVLLTTAGMQQFKKYYVGLADPMRDFGSKNATSVQKAFRTSDIDEIGDEAHLTFFEMLGNFSFGGYFKKEAIAWAHEFITKEMGLPISCVTIFEGEETIGVPKDTESRDIWKALDPRIKIVEQGMEDVFWGPTGSSGPCGPTTEIYCKNAAGEDIEVWNIVFNQFFFNGSREELLQKDVVAGLQPADNTERRLKPATTKKLQKIAIPGVDTGMGLERLAMIAQKVATIFDTDLFRPLIGMIVSPSPAPIGVGAPSPRSTAGRGEGEGEISMRSIRIIVDHLRGAVFLMADGVRPSNVEQGYVLRRVIRRAIRHASLLKLPHGLLAQLIGKVVDLYGAAYPELVRERNNILAAFDDEERKFARTIERGMAEFEKIVHNAPSHGLRPSSPRGRGEGEGQPGVISGINAFHLYDTYGFPLELTVEMAHERGLKVDEEGFKKAFEEHQEKSRAGITGKFGGHGLILDTGELKAANEVEVKIVTRLHTATHMLHKALRGVLGLHVRQQGSDITAQRLRFDFTHPKKLSELEIKQISELVNEKIKEDLPVTSKEETYEEAIAEGALAFFKQKYPPRVKVYSVGNFSKEICGGPHVTHSGEIGHFKIVKEESSAAGVRRIRAVVE